MITFTLDNGREIRITHPGGAFRPFKGDRLVKVRLYGALAKVAGREILELAVSSVRETINALHHLTQGATTKYIADHDKTIRWRVLVNDKQIDGASPSVADELMIERDVESIDLFPVMEGAGSGGIFEAIFGALLIVVGVVVGVLTAGITTPFFAGITYGELASALVVAGISAVLGGLVSLMNTPGKIKQQKTTNTPSYLFSGTVNTQDQGGPVPVAYGNVIIGSQTISAFVESNQQWQVLGSNVQYQLPVPWPNPSSFAREAISGRASAAPGYWQALGPDGIWGYFTGVTILPVTPDTPVLQEPSGLYPYGPIWLMKLDNGSLTASYDPSGNAGPWEPIRNAPTALDAILVTMANDTYADWEPTPNLP